MDASYTNETKPAETELFFSLRIDEALEEARALVQALESARPSLKIFCSGVTQTDAGENLQAKIADAIDAARLAVVFGTRTYAKETLLEPGWVGGYSTYEECMFLKSEGRPFFPLRMCDKLENPRIRLALCGVYKWFDWRPLAAPQTRDGAAVSAAVSIPEGLVEALLCALDRISPAHAAPPSLPPPSTKHYLLHVHPPELELDYPRDLFGKCGGAM